MIRNKGILVGVASSLLLLVASPPHARADGQEIPITIGGLLQVQAGFGDRGDSRFSSDDDRFSLRRARLSFQASFPEHFDFRAEMDFAGSLGETSGLRAQLTDGYVTWTRYREAMVRAGQFKSPFGYEQLIGDPRLAPIERSLANDRLTLGRQIGVQLFGDLAGRRLGYAAAVFNGTGVNTTENDGDTFLYVGRLTALPVEDPAGELRWSLGAAGYTSHDRHVTGVAGFGFDATPADPVPDDVFEGERRGLNLDSELHYGRIDLGLEYFAARFEPDNAIPSPELDSAGGYAQGLASLVPGRLQGLLKYDFFDPDRDRPDSTIETVTLGLNYFIRGDQLKVQVNHLVVHLPETDQDDNRTLLRLQASF